MNPPGFRDLFAWEWRQTGRSRLLWSILLILAASFVWGALNTAALHSAQEAALERARQADAAFHASAKARGRSPIGRTRPMSPATASISSANRR
jgi:ABC-2 type transport system permease protein